MIDKRKIIIVNKKFQFKFLLFINIILFLFFISYPITFAVIINKLALEGMVSFAHYNKMLKFVILLFGILQVFAHLIISIVLVFYSHRIAGPLIKMRTTLGSILKGNDIKEIQFRKNDFFADIDKPINEFINKVLEQNEIIKLTEKEINLLIKSYTETMPTENLKLIQERLSKIKIINNDNP